MIKNHKKTIGMSSFCIAVGMITDYMINNRLAELIIILLLIVLGVCCLYD